MFILLLPLLFLICIVLHPVLMKRADKLNWCIFFVLSLDNNIRRCVGTMYKPGWKAIFRFKDKIITKDIKTHIKECYAVAELPLSLGSCSLGVVSCK